jgi:hypothetical protein
VHLKSGLIRGVFSLVGSSLVVFCYLVASEIWPDKRGGLSWDSKILLNCSPLERPPLLSGQISHALHLKSGLIRGVVSLEGSSLVVFCYLRASEIWPHKRGGLSRGEQFSSILPSHCIWNLAWYEGWSLSSYQARFQMQWDSNILLSYSPLEIPPLLSGQISDALR